MKNLLGEVSTRSIAHKKQETTTELSKDMPEQSKSMTELSGKSKTEKPKKHT